MKPVNVAIIAGVAAVAAIYVLRKSATGLQDLGGALVDKATATAQTIITATGTAIDPTDRNNLAYRATNAVGGALASGTDAGRSADGSWSLGAWFYDVTHPAPAEPAPVGHSAYWKS